MNFKKELFLLITTIFLSIAGYSQRLQVKGKYLISSNNDTITLAGFNWGWWGEAQKGDAEAACTMGANAIRMPLRWYFGGAGSDQRDTTQPGNISPAGLAILDQQIKWCSTNQLWIVLFGGSDQGAGDNTRNYWTDPKIKQQFIDMWQFLANRYKNTPYIAAYEILSEPHPKKPVTSAQIVSFYKQLADSIRIVDANTPFMIGANDHYDINKMDSIYTSLIPNLLYTFNFYLPTDYVKPDKRTEANLPIVSYPSNYINLIGDSVHLDKNYLRKTLEIGTAFRDKYNVPIYINQVAAPSIAPNYLNYTKDVISLFNEQKVGYAWWTWRTADDSTKYGLYYKDSKKNYVLKQSLYNLLDDAMGNYNFCNNTTTGIEVLNENISVFPNPNNGNFHIQNAVNQHLIIQNLMGEIVVSRTVISNYEEVNNLLNGIYLVKVGDKVEKIAIIK